MPRAFALIAAALLLSGCVTTGKYKELESKANDLQSQLDQIHKEAKGLQTDLGAEKASKAQLEKQKGDLETQKSTLESQKAELEKVTASLGAKTAELEKAKADLTAKTAELSAQKQALEAEKAALLKAAQEKQAAYDSLVGDLKKEVNEGNLKITQYKNMLTLDVADKILFDSGKAELRADGKAVLKKVGEAIAKSDKAVRVMGHTDNVPLSAGGAYASNWELSTARALTVVRFLQDQSKIDPKRLMASGRGEHAPVAPNDTPANKARNRRIEIALMDKAMVDGSADAAAAPAQPAAQDAAPAGAKP